MNTEDQSAHCVAYLQEFTKGLLDSFELSSEERRLFHLRFLRGQGKGLPPSWARQAVAQSQKGVPPYAVDCASASIADSSKVFRMMRQQLSSEPDRLHYLHRLCHMVKTRIAPTWSRDGETYVFKCLTGKLLNSQSMRS